MQEELNGLLEDTAEYGTIGEAHPGLFAYYGEKQLNLSGLPSRAQVFSVLDMELDSWPEEKKIAVVAVR